MFLKPKNKVAYCLVSHALGGPRKHLTNELSSLMAQSEVPFRFLVGTSTKSESNITALATIPYVDLRSKDATNHEGGENDTKEQVRDAESVSEGLKKSPAVSCR